MKKYIGLIFISFIMFSCANPSPTPNINEDPTATPQEIVATSSSQQLPCEKTDGTKVTFTLTRYPDGKTQTLKDESGNDQTQPAKCRADQSAEKCYCEIKQGDAVVYFSTSRSTNCDTAFANIGTSNVMAGGTVAIRANQFSCTHTQSPTE